MRTTFSRLLIIAASLVILFACKEKKGLRVGTKKSMPSSPKELLVGKWQFDSVSVGAGVETAVNYLAYKHHFENIHFAFSEDGIMTEFTGDDSSSAPFDWQGDTALLLRDEEPREPFKILKLDTAKLVMYTGDSLILFFNRVKEK